MLCLMHPIMCICCAAWNFLDLIIVATGYISIAGFANVTALRAIRALRPLRAITRIKNMKVRVVRAAVVNHLPCGLSALHAVCVWLR